MAQPFVHEIRVRYGECDPQGVVFNANYLVYCDVAFTELWRSAVGPWGQLVEHGVDAVLADASLRFRAPGRFDDILALRGRITELDKSSMTTLIDIVRDEQLLVETRLRHVFIDAETWRRTEMPEWARERLRSFAISDS